MLRRQAVERPDVMSSPNISSKNKASLGAEDVSLRPFTFVFQSGTTFPGARIAENFIRSRESTKSPFGADVPIPSVERENSVLSSRGVSPSSSNPTRWNTPQSHSTVDTVWEQMNTLEGLRLTSAHPLDKCSRSRTPNSSFWNSLSTPTRDNGPAAGDVAESLGALRLQSQQSTPMPSIAPSIYIPSPSSKRTYQVECEEPPSNPFYHTKFQKALSGAMSCITDMNKVLSSTSLHQEAGSTVHSLQQQAVDLGRQELPSLRIVGMIGDSAVGKSSLINSLLDKPNLAKSSGNGAACTYTVTEYLYHDSDKFTIQVQYFDRDELEHQFKDLLSAYRNIKDPHDNLEPGQQNEQDLQENKEALLHKANLARQTFEAVFTRHLKEDPEALSREEFNTTIEKMMLWVRELLPESEDEETFATVQECADRLVILTSGAGNSFSSSQTGMRWPLIKSMKVYLRAVILSKGLVLADVPGLRDSNLVRARITEQYIRQCDQIFAVLPIERAIDDKSLDNIFKLAQDANLCKVDIVCTKSEQVNPTEAAPERPEHKEAIEVLRKEMESIRVRVNEVAEAIRERKTLNVRHEDLRKDEGYRELVMEHHELKESMTSKEHELFRLLVEIRNTAVIAKLSAKHRKPESEKFPEVFCVSNYLYKDNRSETGPVDLAAIRLSGIPHLRRYCIGIIAESHYRISRQLIDHELPAFLGSVELWVNSGGGNVTLEQQGIREILPKIGECLLKFEDEEILVNAISHVMLGKFKETIADRMTSSATKWSKYAEEANKPWNIWSPASYSAFCRNHGNHSTSAVGYHNWNKEAMACLKEDMEVVWKFFVMDLEEALLKLTANIKKLLDHMHFLAEPRRGNGAFLVRSRNSVMWGLCNSLRHRRDIVLDGIEESREDFLSEMATLKVNTLGSLQTAFVGECMKKTYDEANSIHGPGCTKKEKSIDHWTIRLRAVVRGHAESMQG